MPAIKYREPKHPQTKQLDVSPDDIENATQGSAHNCPFARAAQRLFDVGDRNVSVVGKVGSRPANIMLHGAGEYWDLGDDGGDAIRQYDTCKQMDPGTYTITRRET
jgi:hypothetical protein